MKPIPQEWIRDHLDKLIAIASQMPEGAMRQAILLRVTHGQDLVEAFRDSQDRGGKCE